MALEHVFSTVKLISWLCVGTVLSRTVEIDVECSRGLGMESGQLPDSAITASSSYEPNTVGPAQARLNRDESGGAWCPKVFISPEAASQAPQAPHEFLEVDLTVGGQRPPARLTGVVTQGRYANGMGQEFSPFVVVWYRSVPDSDRFVRYVNRTGHSVLDANRDTFTEVRAWLDPPIPAAHSVRIQPYSDHPRTVCMRIELLGCYLEGDDKLATERPNDRVDLQAAVGPGKKHPLYQTASPTPTLNLESELYEIVEEDNLLRPSDPNRESKGKASRGRSQQNSLEDYDEDDLSVVESWDPEDGDRDAGGVAGDSSKKPAASDVEHEVVLLEPWWDTEYMGVAVGVLVTVIMVLIVIIVFILYKNYSNSRSTGGGGNLANRSPTDTGYYGHRYYTTAASGVGLDDKCVAGPDATTLMLPWSSHPAGGYRACGPDDIMLGAAEEALGSFTDRQLWISSRKLPPTPPSNNSYSSSDEPNSTATNPMRSSANSAHHSYTDSSAEYSSPLLTGQSPVRNSHRTSGSANNNNAAASSLSSRGSNATAKSGAGMVPGGTSGRFQQATVVWDGYYPQTAVAGAGKPPPTSVSHYAATDVIYSGGQNAGGRKMKMEGRPAPTYYL